MGMVNSITLQIIFAVEDCKQKDSDWTVNAFPLYSLPIFLLKHEFKFLNKGRNHDINKKEEINNFSHQQPFWLYVDWINSCGDLPSNTTTYFYLARYC